MDRTRNALPSGPRNSRLRCDVAYRPQCVLEGVMLRRRTYHRERVRARRRAPAQVTRRRTVRGLLARLGTMVRTRTRRVYCPHLACGRDRFEFDVKPQIRMRAGFPRATSISALGVS